MNTVYALGQFSYELAVLSLWLYRSPFHILARSLLLLFGHTSSGFSNSPIWNLQLQAWGELLPLSEPLLLHKMGYQGASQGVRALELTVYYAFWYLKRQSF